MDSEARTASNIQYSDDSNVYKWVPLSLTLVEYPEEANSCFLGDIIGKLFALISLAPFGIAAGFVALILFRRDLHTVTFFLGTICSEALNYILKHLICEKRPLHREDVHVEYGMPSSHAQFVSFFASYIMYFVFIRLHHMNNNTIIENISKILIIVSSMTVAVLVCISRIYLHYHTVSQVLWGVIVGFLFATAWFALTSLVLTPLFPHIVT
ncbi:hypothetical protein D910_00789, partial [Dendroctonus ponderosae]